MEVNASCASPKEEGELEDGEIFDDEPQRQNARPPRRARPNRPAMNKRARLPGPGLNNSLPVPLRVVHPPFPSGLRQAFDSAPRSGFWERSHGALGRFRYRAHRPPDWTRDWTERFTENHSCRNDSPGRKRILTSAATHENSEFTAARRPMNSVPKAEATDESFEVLLLKYKQIQLELECIRKEERMALKEDEEPPAPAVLEEPVSAAREEEKKAFQAFNLKPLRQKLLTPAERDALNTRPAQTPDGDGAERDAGPDDAVKEEECESDLNISAVSDETPVGPVKREDEDDLSELQLRLLALQSASRKWQQKEQQVLKESKDKITKAVKVSQDKSEAPADRNKLSGRGNALCRSQEGARAAKATPDKSKAAAARAKKPAHLTKQAWRKQQLRTWKLQQQQRQQEEQRHKQEEEEERRKREDEIRKIRDLSNQDEQYNRFMKLVGSKHRSRSKSSDADQRKLAKQGLDTSGNLYQYDNYDEVAMETDSEPSSPATSPSHDAFPQESTPYRQGVAQHYLQQMEFMRLAPPPPLPPLPPPDEVEQPPKPPFADEEEEEEMLLREELLKSLANKRAVKAEDASSSSGPPSPALRAVVQPSARNNLAAVSLNTVVSHPRALKFVRGHPAPKAPFVLPRHKSVVVRLNASDDSDSDGESCSPAQSVFGGLESMIKEARRTVEAAKPKHSVSEKENNPVKSAEALPDVKKMEYRLLRDDMASLEKQRSGRLEFVVGVPSPAGSDSELEIMGRVADLQEKFSQHRAQLCKDEALLKQLQQQEIKKKESLKVAEGKVTKLKEQLLASEKIVSANRVLLKKLQEQVQRVQHRVALKKQQSVKLKRDLVQATQKRSSSAAIYSPVKVRRVDHSDIHYAELIAQKKRLQQLESEYALKIQKLKEAQALRQAEPRPAAPQTPGTLYPLPQPSLHDLTQDKLTLSNEDVEAEEDEPQQQIPAAVTPTTRRRSFRESGSFTKPKLCHPETPAASPMPVKHAKAASSGAAGLPELLLGLNVEDLRQRYTQCTGLSELLQEETHSLRYTVDHAESPAKVVQVDFDPMAAHQSRVEAKPEPFGPYHSPLLVFKSYRFSPYYRTKEKLSLRSLSYSNVIEPKKCFCRFDLTGTCNDDDCAWQHMRNCTLTESQLFQDILSYCLPLIGCADSSSTSDISSATEKYIKKLFGANKDRMGTDQKAVLLVSKVNERLKHIPPFTTCKSQRKWRPEAQRVKTAGQDNEDHTSVDVTVPVRHDGRVQERWSWADVCVTQDDKRYFDSETDDISNLETSVLESPNDVQLWIKLAFKYLNQKDTSVSECLDAALNTLSRALEDNREQAEVWCHYLTLFSRRGSKEELQEMCEMAVEHAPHYDVWWTYMSVESAFEGKDFVCGRLISHLLEASHDLRPDVRSFQLLESLLFRVQLSVHTGRQHNALKILKSALDSSVADHLTVPDRCLMWLSYIYLTEFCRLPPSLYDPATSSPSRMVCTDAFLIPWRTATRTPADTIISLFTDAVSRCTDERLSSSEQIQACFPLHSNLIHLYRRLDRCQEAVALCERLLAVCPLYCPLLEITGEVHVSSGHADKAEALWTRAHSDSGSSARIFYQLSRCLHSQGKCSVLEELFDKFMRSFCESVPDQLKSLDVLRHVLGVQTQDLLKAPTLKDHLQHEMVDQLPYLHFLHCFWQSTFGSVREAIDAFEKALGTITKLELIHTLWLDYLSFSSSKMLGLQPSVRELKMFTGLVHRCLETVPTRLTLPFSSSQYWSSFSFHNKVISFCLGCFPQSQHSLVLERLQHIMPTNTELAIRLLQQEWQDGNVEHFKLQSRMLCSSVPTCLAIWKIAIAVEKEQRQRAEVSERSECLLFEAAEGGKTDTLKKIIDKCQEVGVSLNEPLGLEPSQTE
ncbi:Zinc finger C3H1 domain-containing protein [Anabarilius grahami]|uniref:Zinc finger C3H1 domain-containing protein n=1 Tax=Anabarilius grahami TaxID=495550 RepID=A0A3N0YG44_ANAGA|nr:Zinc finger C3H1 domain-containing protein [Anabarilius grahami]